MSNGPWMTLRPSASSPPLPLPTFTTTVVAGDYHVVTAEHTTPDGQRIPLELACRADLAENLDAEALFELTAKGLDFYTGWLGAAYPYAKYGQVFVPELSCLASEDAGCVLVSERLLFRSPDASPAPLRSRTGTVLHEMAHMWFGDCATQQWWDDLWLSESFADFCEATAQVALGLDPDAWSTMSVTERIGAFADDRLPSSHPVASGAATVSEAIATFDGISYAKGAAVLRQLSASVGEENFTTGLRAYLAGHSYGNARLADLLAAVGRAAGKDLTAWSKAWLETAGPNVLRCEFSTDAAGRFTEFSVVQEASERHPVLRPHRVAVGLYRRSGDSLERVGRVGRRRGRRADGGAVAARGAPSRPDPAQRRRHRLRHRPVRSAVAGDGAVLGRRPAGPARPRRVLERGHRHGPPGGAAGHGVRGDAGAGDAVRTLAAGADALQEQAEWLISAVRDAEPGGGSQDAAGNGRRRADPRPRRRTAERARWAALRRLAAAGQADDARIDAELAGGPVGRGPPQRRRLPGRDPRRRAQGGGLAAPDQRRDRSGDGHGGRRRLHATRARRPARARTPSATWRRCRACGGRATATCGCGSRARCSRIRP